MKDLSNTNVFEYSGKLYSIAENRRPQEINIFTLETVDNWDVDKSYNRCFTAHPKVIIHNNCQAFHSSLVPTAYKYLLCFIQRAPDTRELVIVGMCETKPFLELGIVSGIFPLQKTYRKLSFRDMQVSSYSFF